MAQPRQNLGDTGHADPADADEMDGSQSGGQQRAVTHADRPAPFAAAM